MTDNPGKGHGAGSQPWQFAPGKSGNPGGRKRDKELTALARAFTLEALETLAAVMRNHKEMAKDRVKAAEVLLDRGWGKARESVELTGAKGGPVQIEDTRRPIVDFIARALADVTDGTAPTQH